MNMADRFPCARLRSGSTWLASAASLDDVCAALMVNKKRIVMDDFFTHRWIGGDLSGESGHVRGEERMSSTQTPAPINTSEAEAAESGRGTADPGSPAIADVQQSVTRGNEILQSSGEEKETS